MINKLILNRYAEALYNNASDNALDQLVNEVSAFILTIKNSPELQKLLKAPLVSSEKKVLILNNLVNGFDSKKTFAGLFSVLKQNKRIHLLNDIMIYFLDLVAKKRGYKKSVIYSSSKLNDELKNQIKNKVKETFGEKVKFDFKMDESLLGGLRILVDSKMIDLSIKNKLQQFTHNLKGDI